MVKIELNKRDSFLVAFLVVLVGVGFVYAYGGSDPSVMGHSAGELDIDNTNANTICSGNEVLTGTGACLDINDLIAIDGNIPTCLGDDEALKFDGSDFLCAEVGKAGGTPCDWIGWSNAVQTFLTCPSFAPGCECLDSNCETISYCNNNFVTETKTTCGCVECGTGCHY